MFVSLGLSLRPGDFHDMATSDIGSTSAYSSVNVGKVIHFIYSSFDWGHIIDTRN